MTNVLVIDDEAPIRLLCRVNLEAEGMKVAEAADGPSGLEKARREPARRDPARRDDAGPRRVARRGAARRRPATRGIPIVFLTARAEFRDRAKGLDIGGVDYITKPFNPLELAPLVRDLLARIDRGERDQLRREKLADLEALMEE
jgi:DNA-binding response OmpR family regulator